MERVTDGVGMAGSIGMVGKLAGGMVTSLLNVFTKREHILDSDKRVCDDRNVTRITSK